MIWHGLADQLIFPQGTTNYYERVKELLGGSRRTEDFARALPRPWRRALRRRSGPVTGQPA